MASIVSIKSSTLPNRVYVSFSDNIVIPLPVDDVIILSLKKGEILDEERYRVLAHRSLYYLLREYALRQVAISPKIAAVLRPKLNGYLKKVAQKYKISQFVAQSDLVDKTIDYLDTQKLLNETDYAAYIVRKNRTKPKNYIRMLLIKKGVDQQIIISLLENDNNDRQKIINLLQKKHINAADLTDIKTKNKILSLLYRRGFSLSEALSVIDDILHSR